MKRRTKRIIHKEGKTRSKFYRSIGVVFLCNLAILSMISCQHLSGGEDLLSKMKKEVPICQGAKVLESYMPMEKMSVIKLDVDAKKASQEDILNFYKDVMTKKGWELKGLKDYGVNGSVMELAKKDWGTLSIQTITKKTKKTGKIPVVLSLSLK